MGDVKDRATQPTEPSTSPLVAAVSMTHIPPRISPPPLQAPCGSFEAVPGATPASKVATMMLAKAVQVGCAGDRVLFVHSDADAVSLSFCGWSIRHRRCSAASDPF